MMIWNCSKESQTNLCNYAK